MEQRSPQKESPTALRFFHAHPGKGFSRALPPLFSHTVVEPEKPLIRRCSYPLPLSPLP
jgi:hypothetical protein